MYCPAHAQGRCRSCTLIEQPYERQLADKQAHCAALLAPFGDFPWLPPAQSAPQGFRNKAKMGVAGSVDAPVLGVLSPQGPAHDLSDCPLYPEALARHFPALREFITLARLTPYDLSTRRGELKYLLLTLCEQSGRLMLRFVLRSTEALPRLRKHLPQLLCAIPELTLVSANLQPEHKAVLEGEQEIHLYGEESLPMQLGEITLHLRPKSFFQTHSTLARELYLTARAWVGELAPRGLWDLFCGVGGFALHCAREVQGPVTGIEISAEAIASAQRSATEGGLSGLHFRALDATDFARGGADVPELVLVNPPRRGIGDALCDFLAASPARWVLYSSCNPETLARDIRRMRVFTPRKARLFDLFPHTGHCEVLVLLERAARGIR